MKRFRFRLQRILDLRRARETEALRHLAGALHEVRAAEAERKRARDGRDALCRNLHDDLAAGGGPAAWMMRHVARMESAVVACSLAVDRAEANVRAARETVTERRKDVKALDELRKRDQVLFDEERERVENAAMDEIAAGRHARSHLPESVS